jgi:hypothetical protein
MRTTRHRTAWQTCSSALASAGPELESFKPKYGGLASAGAVLYIEKRKLKKLRGGVKIDPSCLALVGQIVFDGASSARKAVTPSITGLLR